MLSHREKSYALYSSQRSILLCQYRSGVVLFKTPVGTTTIVCRTFLDVAISYFKWSRTHFHRFKLAEARSEWATSLPACRSSAANECEKSKSMFRRSPSLMLSVVSIQWVQVARGDVFGVFTYACFIRVASIRWGARCAHPPVLQYRSRQMAQAHLAAQNQKPTAWSAVLAHQTFSKFYIATKKWYSKMRSYSVCVCPVCKLNGRSRYRRRWLRVCRWLNLCCIICNVMCCRSAFPNRTNRGN